MNNKIDDMAVVALGSNLAGKFASIEGLLEAALARMAEAGLAVRARSSWWRSTSWPDLTAPDYLNGVTLVEPTLSPETMLARLRGIEAAFGRVRMNVNAPRTLDLDLIAHGRSRRSDPELTLPHPRAADRLFVMGPLAEIAPDWIHPVFGETVSVLARKASVGRDARPI